MTQTEEISRAASTRRLYQRVIPTFLVSFLATILVIMYFFAPLGKTTAGKAIDPITPEFTQWGSIVTTISFLFGYLSIPLIHVRRLVARKVNKKMLFGSAVSLISLGLMLIIIYFGPGGAGGVVYSTWNLYMVGFVNNGMRADWAWHPYTSFRIMRITALASGLFVVYVDSRHRRGTGRYFVRELPWRPNCRSFPSPKSTGDSFCFFIRHLCDFCDFK